MIYIQNAGALPAQKPFQPGFPLDERQAAQIYSIQVQHIECEEQALPTPEQQVIEDGPA
jgi:hypothetical protein